MTTWGNGSSRARLAFPGHCNTHHHSPLKGKSVELLWIISDHLTTNHRSLVHICEADPTTDGCVCNKQLLIFMNKPPIHYTPVVTRVCCLFRRKDSGHLHVSSFRVNALKIKRMILFIHCPCPTLKCHLWNTPKGLIFQLEKCGVCWHYLEKDFRLCVLR